VFLYGGYIDYPGFYSNDSWVYDASEDSWVLKSPPNYPDGRAKHAMTGFNDTDQVLLFGGENNYGILNDTWLYDLSDNNWTQATNGPGIRRFHALASVFGTDKIVLFGGDFGFGYLNDTWIFDLSDNKWEKQHPGI